MSNASAAFIGDGSLLIQCAEAFLDAGHAIRFVASHTQNILQWADSKGIQAVRLDAESDIEVPAGEFDYLFSVANLRVLPAALIARARKLAVNFHDAPLPRYAGLNATSWALMAQEKDHGVTWHEMTPAVDAGRIVRQATFAIGPAETAFSLNTKCYEAGLAIFKSIVQDIGTRRSLPHRTNRPAQLFRPRPSAPGPGHARFLAAGNGTGRARACARLRALPQRAGTAQDLSWRLGAAGSHCKRRIHSLRSPRPEHCSKSMDRRCALPRAMATSCWAGAWTPRAGPRTASRLEWFSHALTPRCARDWPCARRKSRRAKFSGAGLSRRFRRLSFPIRETYCRPSRSRPSINSLDAPARGSQTAAAFLAWLSALCGQERVSVMYCDAALSQRADGLASWLSPWVPLTLVTSPEDSAVQVAAAAEVQVARTREAGPYARDLALRLDHRQSGLAQVGKIGICLDHAAPLGDFELLLTADASGDGIELVADAGVFAGETVQLMAVHLGAWLRAFACAKGRMADIPLAPAAEAQAIARINATATAYDSDTCVHEAISAQAARTPQHEAICCQGQSLSYRELDEKAVHLAARLQERGIVPGDIVGICMERSPGLVIAVLAIMKTGAAYLPLDPDYPPDRIAFMIEDSQTRLIVADAALPATLALPPDRTLLLDEQPPGSRRGADAPDGACGQPSLCDLHLGLHRPAQGRYGDTSQCGEFLHRHGPAHTARARRALACRDQPLLRHLGARAVLDPGPRAHRRAAFQHRAGAGQAGGFQPLLLRERQLFQPAGPVQAAARRARSSPTSTASPPSGRPSATSTPSAASTPTRR